MANPVVPGDTLKDSLKSAVVEALHEQREFLHEVFAEVLEDFAMTEAIREGRETKRAKREDIFDILKTA